MAVNNLIFSFLNPVKFTKLVPDQVAQYVSKHMDDWPFVSTIYKWEQATHYCQPWQLSDNIRLQLQSNSGPINLKVVNQDEVAVHDVNFVQKQQNDDDATLFIYEIDLALSIFSEGGYYLKISIGNPVSVVYVSEPLVFSELIENTVTLEFKHWRFYQDIVFETGFSPSIRIPATLKPKSFASKDTIYEDQPLNLTMVKSVPYRIWELSIGGARGIPDYLADKLNRVFGCSTLKIDGKLYTKNEGAKLEPSDLENYPMRGWTIELREKLNRSSRIFVDDVAVDQNAYTIVTVDTKGFGTMPGGPAFVEDVI